MSMAEDHDIKSRLEEATKANISLHSYIEELEDQLHSNKDQVDAYREQILELSQSQDDVSDDAIRKTLQSVFDGIESWIDELSSQQGFDDQFSAHFATRLKNPKAQSFLTERTHDAGVDWVKVGRSDNCTYTILSLVIGDRLQHEVFRIPEAPSYGHIYPIEVPGEYARVLRQVQEKIRSTDKEGK